MKKKTVTAIAVAAILIVAGVALAAVAFEMGGGARKLLADGNLSFGSRYDRNEGSIGSWPGDGDTAVSVDAIVVNWISGSVIIEAADVDEVTFSESADRSIDEEDKLVYRIEKDTLYIDYCREKNVVGIFGDGNDMPAKQLKITVPLELISISVDTTSADVTLNGVELERLSIDSTSGSIFVQNFGAVNVELGSTSGAIDFYGVAEEFDALTTSGNIFFSGSAGEFDAESTSGDISFGGRAKGFSVDTTSGLIHACFQYLTSLPAELDVETVSGDVELILPLGGEFSLEFDTVSGGFDCEFAFKMHDGKYLVGNGSAEISVSTVSGDCAVKTAR